MGLLFLANHTYITDVIHIRPVAIRALMRREGMVTQVDFGDRLGWDKSRVSRLLNGRVNPGPKTINRLCEILRCQPGDILEYR